MRERNRAQVNSESRDELFQMESDYGVSSSESLSAIKGGEAACHNLLDCLRVHNRRHRRLGYYILLALEVQVILACRILQKQEAEDIYLFDSHVPEGIPHQADQKKY